MADWTAADLPDLSGTTVVLTGANSGIGLEATRELAGAGAHVVMACRRVDAAAAAREDVVSEYPAASLTIRELDLADLASVRAFAAWAADSLGPIDVLCNNAGVMAIPRRETADGFERQFGVNHLGHVALTGLLFEQVLAAPDPRVVTHSSGAHARGTIDFEDLHGEADYDRWAAYARSKLANLLFAYELDRRYDDVTSVGCHPGYAATNLQYRGPEAEGSRLRWLAMKLANTLLAQSAAAGALPMLYAATADDVEGGDYVGPGGLLNARGPPEILESAGRSYDETTAERLWEVSVEATGVEFP
ncbi:short-chain dehydrogenase [Halobacteriales archaeon SW_12_69_24]|nr:MAG: short-chain dehydrogenase [Halobacteriales archaeon SW_12_69_24]